MPENDPCEGVVIALKQQFDRIGQLLHELDDGRWWPDDRAGNEDADTVLLHTRRIEESLQEIARIVAAMKD
ncbi:hypothetical protein [Methylobacterium longum]|uniref:Uncharacterized protein n=1 Tax=Methylobacterium longum TaxID=767694 RepID=A0ABT8AKN0_9HYPH|nr:hypothetical protein [Methylobacterium longum]MDN3569848.1 hypothetical protein [Methylobacterium longum]GJE13258.1 hypothetical protein FOHLNKBM_4321 [Methylobacterium longum]